MVSKVGFLYNLVPVVVVLTYLFLSKDQEEAQNVIAVLQLTVEETMGLLAEVSLHVTLHSCGV